MEKLNTLLAQSLSSLIRKIKILSKKYTENLPEMGRQSGGTETELSGLLEQLTGSAEDLAGLAEYKKMLEDK